MDIWVSTETWGIMRVSPEDGGQAIDERTSLGPSLPPTSYSRLRHAALNFRENIQRPQLEMNFSISDLSTQIFPLMTQFPDNFLLRAATTRLICLCCHPAIFTLVRKEDKPRTVADSHRFWLTMDLLLRNQWVAEPLVKIWWSQSDISTQLAIILPWFKSSTKYNIHHFLATAPLPFTFCPCCPSLH